jgi:D-glycero-D-manno-heptose 1,7-bisphosphate phosphatase
MLERAAREHDLDLGSSFVVGDRYQDLQMGFKFHARTVLVATGYGKGELLYRQDSWQHKPDHLACDLLEATVWILASLDQQPQMLPGARDLT